MKVLLALASASPAISGVQRHALDLAAALASQSEVESVHLVVSPWQREMIESHNNTMPHVEVHFADMARARLARNLWYYRSLPRLAQKIDADLVHLTHPMPLRSSRHFASVVTLHDLYPMDSPANFAFPHVLVNRAVLHQCLGAADAISCVSRSTLTRLQHHFGSRATEKASVISNILAPYRAIEQRRAQQPFLLCVAQHRRNKNIPLALSVFRSLLYRGILQPLTRFVLVGIPGPESKRLRRLIVLYGLESHVDLLHGISEAELNHLYATCQLVLAPSTNEGFGLPVVEALQRGARVVCSDIPAFRELAVGRCPMVPLNEGAEERFTAATAAALQAPAPSPWHFPELSQERIVQQWLQLYRRLIVSKAKSRAQYSLPNGARVL